MLRHSWIRTPSVVSAGRSRRFRSLRLQRALFFDFVPIARNRLFVGMQDHPSVIAVDNHRVAAGDFGQEWPHADDGRNFQALWPRSPCGCRALRPR